MGGAYRRYSRGRRAVWRVDGSLSSARTNLDFDGDVPQIGVGDESVTSSFTRKVSEKRRLHRVVGEVWRDEWVEPGTRSTRIRRDAPHPPIAFLIDAAGKKQTAGKLVDSGRWLWFKPDIIPALLELRGASLGWYTRETGGVRGSPDYQIHFGINSLGLVNAYAKDVALQPEWLQRIWAGFNVSPEGKVSAELFAAQGEGIPAPTQAPEGYLRDGVTLLNEAFAKRFGIRSSVLTRLHTSIQVMPPVQGIERIRSVRTGEGVGALGCRAH